jgi:hypothetical protein
MDIFVKISFLAATCFTGLLCGASLDQSFKQLPSRHRIGMIAFSIYARAADLKNGVLWYGIIGVGAALSTIMTAIMIWQNSVTRDFDFLIYAAGIFSICHSICTSRAAPVYFKQKAISDEESLAKIFKKFEIIQTIRSVFIALSFISLLSASFVLLASIN